ncbi:MAG: hypothetical protein OEV48_03995 [Acidobacteriota bacterium]|nr:hypothetical protein [Acidobacteriota bacterium]
MTELEAEPGSQGMRRELAAALLTATVIAVAVTLLYGPTFETYAPSKRWCWAAASLTDWETDHV